jgi:hypothetical protein
MNCALRSFFQRDRLFFPVIHPVSEQIALESVATAVACDADGVFVINQGMTSQRLIPLVVRIHERFPSLWLGVNFLGIHPDVALEKITQLPIDGLWADNAGIDERSHAQPYAERFCEARKRVGWTGLYFGGVAFKYQCDIPDSFLADAARCATPWVDVITTSGSGTGEAISLDKLKSLRKGAGDHPIALASGVTAENVTTFLPYVEAYLVATSIETYAGSGVLVPDRTKQLAEIIHSWQD